MDKQRLAKGIHWLFAAVTAVYLLSGYGITEYRVVEPLTLGLLTKNLAFSIHLELGPVFFALLVLHTFLSQTVSSTRK